MWPSALSGRLLIVALVGFYPANWLIRCGSIPSRFGVCTRITYPSVSSRLQNPALSSLAVARYVFASTPCILKPVLRHPDKSFLCSHRSFHTEGCPSVRLCGIISRFQLLSPWMDQVIHTLLTRPPLSINKIRSVASYFSLQRQYPVRLACVRHAASVHPEPGSNSRFKSFASFKMRFVLFLLGLPLRSPLRVAVLFAFAFRFVRFLLLFGLKNCLLCVFFQSCVAV